MWFRGRFLKDSPSSQYEHKGIVLLIILVLGAALFSLSLVVRRKPVQKKAVSGMPAPDFELTDITGSMHLADFRESMLVNFWPLVRFV